MAAGYARADQPRCCRPQDRTSSGATAHSDRTGDALGRLTATTAANPEDPQNNADSAFEALLDGRDY